MSKPLQLTIDQDFDLEVGESTELTPVVFPKPDQQPEISWKSSAPDIVSVENGTITVHRPGTATITATLDKPSDSVKITGYIPLVGIDISDDEIYIVSGETCKLEFFPDPANATASFEWRMETYWNDEYYEQLLEEGLDWEDAEDIPPVASISNDGTITGITPGSAYVYVDAYDHFGEDISEIWAEGEVNVCYPVTDAWFEEDYIRGYVGEELYAEVTVESGYEEFCNELVTFTSSDEDIAIVDPKTGDVKITGVGQATITVAARSGVSAQCRVEGYGAIVLPEEWEVIHEETFSGSTAEYFVLPDDLSAIEERAFTNCKNVEKMYIPSSVKSIAPDAFSGSDKLVIYCQENSAAHLYAIEQEIPFVLGYAD